MIGAHVAPCGHPGECIIGNFVRCLQNCESGASSREVESPGELDRRPDRHRLELARSRGRVSEVLDRPSRLRRGRVGVEEAAGPAQHHVHPLRPAGAAGHLYPAGLARHPGETDGQLRQRAKPFNFGTHGVSIGHSTPAVDVSPDGTLLPTPPALDAVQGMEEWITARRQWRSHILAYYPKHVFYTDNI